MESPLDRRQSKLWQDEDNLGDVEKEQMRFDSDGLTDIDVAESIEHPEYSWKLPLAHDALGSQRQVSTATAIYLDDDHEDPFAEDEEQEKSFEVHGSRSGSKGGYEDVFEDEEDTPSSFRGYRKPSSTETFSTIPEAHDDAPLGLYTSSAGARSNSSVLHTPVTQRTRRMLPTNRLLSSPAQPDSSTRYYSAAKTRYTSSPLAQRQHPSGFRNASSIRAMQMSSPSPPPGSSPRFAQSPRSARQRRLEREDSYRSRSGTPSSQHPNPKKEYPLILLHCSFTALFPPFAPSVLANALPPWIQENLTLLHEKLNTTVVERGILIPHPGEDYELLEERILESLELKRPRVGKCGHFLGSRTPNDDEDVHKLEDEEHDHIFKDEKCMTCARSVFSSHNGTAGDTPSRRFDIKVFAANGLMRAGAWTAAWREMEKVDIEIGVWIPEDVRAILDQEAQNVALEHSSMFERGEDDVDRATVRGSRRDFTYLKAPSPPPRSTLRQRHRSDTLGSSGPASTAACSKPAAATESTSQRAREQTHAKAPLSELLTNYIKRKVPHTQQLLLHVSLVLLAVMVLRLQFIGTSSSSLSLPNASAFAPFNVLQDAAHGVMTTHAAAALIGEAGDVGGVSKSNPATTVTTTITAHAMAACTFTPDQAEGLGMTALPSELAMRALDALAVTDDSGVEAVNNPTGETSINLADDESGSQLEE